MNDTYWDDEIDGFKFDINEIECELNTDNYFDRDIYEWEYMMYLKDRGE